LKKKKKIKKSKPPSTCACGSRLASAAVRCPVPQPKSTTDLTLSEKLICSIKSKKGLSLDRWFFRYCEAFQMSRTSRLLRIANQSRRKNEKKKQQRFWISSFLIKSFKHQFAAASALLKWATLSFETTHLGKKTNNKKRRKA
jgi:hypothetical protein